MKLSIDSIIERMVNGADYPSLDGSPAAFGKLLDVARTPARKSVILAPSGR